MKIQLLILVCGFLLASCNKPLLNEQLPGLWKIEKVEVRLDGQIKRLIKDSSHFWQIFEKDSIRIFTPGKLQNSFPITVHKLSIKSPADDFKIDKLNSEHLELSSIKNLQEATYTVIYYLDRVEDGN